MSGFWDRAHQAAASTPLWELWSPPLDPPTEGGLPRAVAEQIVASWWNDNQHECAAVLWETWAATLPPEASVRSVQTGVQAITFESPGGKFALAMSRAAWHREQAGSFASVPLDLAPPG